MNCRCFVSRSGAAVCFSVWTELFLFLKTLLSLRYYYYWYWPRQPCSTCACHKRFVGKSPCRKGNP